MKQEPPALQGGEDFRNDEAESTLKIISETRKLSRDRYQNIGDRLGQL